MGRKKEPAHKYGAALYGTVWLPGGYAFMAGGGGHGLEDKIVVVCCAGGQLSEEVEKLSLGKGRTPYRMLAHPSGGLFLFADQPAGNLHRVDVGHRPDGSPPELLLDAGDFGERAAAFAKINCMAFSRDGRLLALGGEDGAVSLLDFPSLALRQRWEASKSEIRTLEISAPHGNGAVLSIDQAGATVVWDARSGEEIMRLTQPADMPRSKPLWGRFAAEPGGGISLYMIAVWKQEGYLQHWAQNEAGDLVFLRKRRLADAPVPIADISPGGDLIAGGTSEGDIVVISTETFKPVKYVRGAHMVYGTAVTFAPDASAVLSVSSDASAVTVPLGRGAARGGSSGGGGLGLIMLLLALVAALVAALLAAARFAVQQGQLQLSALPAWLPPELVRLALGQPPGGSGYS